jgi:hypothetical protein
LVTDFASLSLYRRDRSPPSVCQRIGRSGGEYTHDHAEYHSSNFRIWHELTGLEDIEARRHNSAVGGANLPPRIPVADPVEAALDFGKASLDYRLELAVGENVGPVVLDSFANELAHVERVNAATDAIG